MKHDDITDSLVKYAHVANATMLTPTSRGSTISKNWYYDMVNTYLAQQTPSKENQIRQHLNNIQSKIDSLKARINNSLSKQDRKSINSQIAYYEKQYNSYYHNNVEYLI